LRLADFDYPLPEERIAEAPLARRDASQMMLLDRGSRAWEDAWVRELPERLRGDETIVVNNARVMPARLFGHREGVGAEPPGQNLQSRARREFLQSQIEVLLLRRLAADRWEALVRPGRKVRTGERIFFGEGLEAEIIGRGAFGLRELRFTSAGEIEEALERLGHVPLPPYLHRPDEPADRERYQTIFARQGFAAAAPTAGLHFSTELVDRLARRGIELVELTLEVGLGTFQPIRADRVEDHRIHSEGYEIPEATAQTIARAKREGRPVLAVGTTVVRALEDAAAKFACSENHDGQESSAGAVPAAGRSEAELYIYPGFRFRVVDQLLTNFHLPRSSLLVMVSAFAGREFLLDAYRHAIDQGYRFYSYGDCMFIR
jgi:S-adenosylmethionine:tRNA ribosyltransferase-isomerase